MRLTVLSAMLVVLASLGVLACSSREPNSPASLEEGAPQRPQDEGFESASATPDPQPTGTVGDTLKLGAVDVTLNDTRRESFGDYTTSATVYADGSTNPAEVVQGHYYIVFDITMKNEGTAQVGAYSLTYSLMDEEGYLFETEPLSDQKPSPTGQPIPPGGILSGEVGFDLGTKPHDGPFSLAVSLTDQPAVTPVSFEIKG